MTSRKTGPSLVAQRATQGPASRPAPRSAGMSVARAITKTVPAGTASKAPRARKPRLEELAAAAAAPSQALPQGALRTPKTRGSYKTSSRTDQQRLAELKIKLGDPDYMEGAILRIATVLSARLTLR
jgi:hypothetical protein